MGHLKAHGDGAGPTLHAKNHYGTVKGLNHLAEHARLVQPSGGAADAGAEMPAASSGGCGCVVGRASSSTSAARWLVVTALLVRGVRRRRDTDS